MCGELNKQGNIINMEVSMTCTCKIFQGLTEKNNVKIVYINDRFLETQCLFTAVIEHTLMAKL
jgi:hypothetical protein